MNSRIVYINSADKIHLYLNNVEVVRGDTRLSVPIEDICAIIIESSTTLFSMQLLDKLACNNVCVIFCNEKHLPSSQVIPLHNYARQTKSILSQINVAQSTKDEVWAQIVKAKIANQCQTLRLLGKTERISKMQEYIDEVESGDVTNREGLAAKQYFTELFDDKFDRQDETFINSCLDYAYAILLSLIAKSISGNGLILPLGIHHKSEYNHYALACDFMEPLRPVFDYYTLKIAKDETKLTPLAKAKLCNIVHEKVVLNNKMYDICTAIDTYVSALCKSVLTNGITLISDINSFPRLPGEKDV